MRHPVTVTLNLNGSDSKPESKHIVMEYGQTVSELLTACKSDMTLVNCHGKKLYLNMPLRGDMDVWQAKS